MDIGQVACVLAIIPCVLPSGKGYSIGPIFGGYKIWRVKYNGGLVGSGRVFRCWYFKVVKCVRGSGVWGRGVGRGCLWPWSGGGSAAGADANDS